MKCKHNRNTFANIAQIYIENITKNVRMAKNFVIKLPTCPNNNITMIL